VETHVVASVHPFVIEFVRRIGKVTDEVSLRSFNKWLHVGNPASVYSRALNAQLRLPARDPKYELREDLPCLTVGSRSGLLLLLANPGWDMKENPPWNRACADATPSGYHDLLVNFFHEWPRIVGRAVKKNAQRSYGQFWTQAIPALRLLRPGPVPVGAAERWAHAHASRLFGSWDLFPMMSDKDGLSQHVRRRPDLQALAFASVMAALKFRPKVLLVASANGSRLVRSILNADGARSWTHVRTRKQTKRGEMRVCSWRTVVEHEGGASTEVVTAGTQVFSRKGSFVLDVDKLCDEVVPALRTAGSDAVACPSCGWPGVE
jgi:hypothetical protein